MTARRNVYLVARREYVERLRDRSFLISTAVVIAILLFITVLPRFLGADDAERFTVGLAGGKSAELARPLVAGGPSIGARVEVRRLAADAASAEALVREGTLDAAVVDGVGLLAGDDPSEPLLALVQSASRELRARRALEAAGVGPQVVQQVLRPVPLPVRTVAPGTDPAARNVARVGSFLLYFQLITYGYWVASGVVEEKASRVVELLLAAIRPTHLLAGKVIGIGLLGLTQLAVLGLVGLVGSTATGVLEVRAGVLGTVGLVALWFLLGYAFYSCAFAVAGATVSRQEELQNTTTPLTLVMVAAFVVAVLVGNEPGSELAQVSMFVPPVAPLVMPVLVVAGEVSAWELVLSVAVSVGATVALVPLAARIYAGAVLRTGGRVKLRQALRSA
ncbi:MAG TPA: ABC transporter permease [Actinomycetes bacterium]|nr:ABC transporter permease [Actinomycetes bacterium]